MIVLHFLNLIRFLLLNFIVISYDLVHFRHINKIIFIYKLKYE